LDGAGVVMKMNGKTKTPETQSEPPAYVGLEEKIREKNHGYGR